LRLPRQNDGEPNSNRYRKEWSFPPIVEKKLEEFLVSPCLHVCPGASELGDVKLDLYTRADVKGDMLHLPFRDQRFQTVLIDPPWHFPNHLRPRLLWELRRVLMIRGRLILDCPWIPNVPGMRLDRVLVGRPPQIWTPVSLFGFYTRVQQTLDPTPGSVSEIRIPMMRAP
jgi:hypothetical protein